MDLHVEHWLERQMFLRGCWEEEDAHTFARLLPADAQVLDVGANVGFYSLLAAVAGAQHVVSVEPGAESYRRLLHNVRLNGLRNIDALKVGAGDIPGEARLTISARDLGSSSIVERPGHSAGHEVVQVEALDAIAERTGMAHPNVVKIDVEGMESAVVRSGRAVLSERPILMIEVNDCALRQGRSSAATLRAELRCLGYRLYASQGGRLVHDAMPAMRWYNLFALPE